MHRPAAIKCLGLSLCIAEWSLYMIASTPMADAKKLDVINVATHHTYGVNPKLNQLVLQ